MKVTDKNINDIGLSVFQTIKKIKGSSVQFEELNNSDSEPIDHGQWTELLQKHVSNNGLVDYSAFIQDSLALNQYLILLSNHPASSEWTEKEQLAYWINAYNAFTVKLILNHYPVESIKDIGGNITMVNSPWDIKFFKIGGIDFDLNTIEHEILRKEFEEPRIHFAVNCASISCPKLRSEAFVAEKLEEQLEEQAIASINDPHKNELDSQPIKISQVFNWFKSDFTKDQSLIEFLNKYSVTPINKKIKIDYMDYDWGLNNAN